MNTQDKLLCAAYITIAAVALVATWSNNLVFLGEHPWDLVAFVRAGYVNPAAASLTNDLLLFALAGAIFMVHESRRLAIRWVWVYLVLSALVAVSVMFPLFLVARQIRIAAAR